MATRVAVARIPDVPPGATRIVEALGHTIALCNVDGQFYAIDDRCSHEDASLGEGTLLGHLLECPRHGARFDVRTGQPVTLPAVIPVARYLVKIEGDQVFVEVP